MAYSELVKNFDNIRMVMRDFYVYGFKSKADFNEKVAAPTIMTAVALKAGWLTICAFVKTLRASVALFLWTAAKSSIILFTRL